MHSRSTLTEQQREELITLFEAGMGSRAAAVRLNVSRGPARRLERRWRLHGRLCLMGKSSRPSYPFEIKKEIVSRFLAGETTMDLAAEYGLSSDNQARTWVRQWRQGGDDALRPKPRGRPKGSGTPQPLTEEEKLRRQVARLEAENAYLKKLRDLRNQGLV